MTCPKCGRGLRARRAQAYRYRESGLDEVFLTGIRVFTCPGCRGQFPEIPNIVGLHRIIAGDLAAKPAPLTGAEFRFLRKELGFKAKDLARYLGTTDVNLSRWEAGVTPVNAAADRLLRVLYALHTVGADRAVAPASLARAALETFERITTVKRPKPLRLRIPSNRLLASRGRGAKELAAA